MKYTLLTIIILTIFHYSFAQNNFKITGGNVKVVGNTDLVLNNTQFTNNGSFNAGTGTSYIHITGDGTDAQSAIGGSLITTFYNLKINKTSNGIPNTA